MIPPTSPPILNHTFLVGQLALARGFLAVAEAADDDAVARRNLALAERALTFIQKRMPQKEAAGSILVACEELTARTQALRISNA